MKNGGGSIYNWQPSPPSACMFNLIQTVDWNCYAVSVVCESCERAQVQHYPLNTLEHQNVNRAWYQDEVTEGYTYSRLPLVATGCHRLLFSSFVWQYSGRLTRTIPYLAFSMCLPMCVMARI